MSLPQLPSANAPPPSLLPGLAVGLASLLLFMLVAGSVLQGGALGAVDLSLAQSLHARLHPSLTALMAWISMLHDTWGILLACAGIGAWLARRGNTGWLLRLLVCVPGGMIVNWLLKQVVQRPRPVLEAPLVHLSSYSFPSGHTASVTLLYGFLCAYCWRHTSARLGALALALPMVLLVGFSRLYLGAHYLSDVLGALFEGLAWLALCLTGAQCLERRQP